jgi:hypothetical protein
MVSVFFLHPGSEVFVEGREGVDIPGIGKNVFRLRENVAVASTPDNLFSPDDRRDKIVLSKDLITEQSEAGELPVVDAGKKDPVISKKPPCKKKSGRHHGKPRCMAVPVSPPGSESVVVEKPVARIVGRVDIDHPDLSLERGEKKLQCIEVVTADKGVTAGVVLKFLIKYRFWWIRGRNPGSTASWPVDKSARRLHFWWLQYINGKEGHFDHIRVGEWIKA